MVLIGISLCLRIISPYSVVFSDQGIKFLGMDANYHMRLVENLLHHFPQHITFDPYTAFPDGNSLAWPPFFDWLLGGIAWLIGSGSPSENLINLVGVYLPPILGALVIIPVFFIGKILFNRWVGLLAAGLIALLPGQFFDRSVLGYADHHVLEVLLSTTVMLFLILALKAARQDGSSLNPGWRDGWKNKKLLIYASLTGIFLSAFLLTWEGGLLIVLLIFIYYILQFILDTWKGRSTAYLGIIGIVSMFIVAVLVIAFQPRNINYSIYRFALPLAVVLPAILSMLSSLTIKRNLKHFYYPVILLGISIAGVVGLYFVDRSLLNAIMSQLARVFNSLGTATTISEMRPLFFPSDSFTLKAVWQNFTTVFWISLIAGIVLIYALIKNHEAGKMLLLVWFFIILIVTLTQVRFAYYLAVEIALLTAYLSWQVLHYFGFGKVINEPVAIVEKKKKRKKEKRDKPRSRLPVMGTGMALVLLIVFLPNAIVSVKTSKEMTALAMPNYWHKALTWLKENTPEPFDNADYYYQVYSSPPSGTSYAYPASAYSVMSWWDYGHWITETAHRIPVANPFQQGASTAGKFFTAQDEVAADGIADQSDVKYVVVDAKMGAKFSAFLTFINENSSDYFEIYYLVKNGELKPTTIFYPKYYQSMYARLYLFEGKQVEPQSTTVVTYEDKVSSNGNPYKEIKSLQNFDTYAGAAAYISQNPAAKCKIVGTDADVSPVPIEALNDYKMVYESDEKVKDANYGSVVPIKIFDYNKAD